MSASISIFGLGYVGSVSAACFAHLGHRVIGVDVNPHKVEMLESGRSPIVEARMDELVAAGRAACRLHATTDPRAAIYESDISFICVATPSLRSGKLDVSHVEKVAAEIGSLLPAKKRPHTIVVRSTILPGTTDSLVVPALENASGLHAGVDFSVCYNPEFMREGSAVADFLEPPLTVLGAGEMEGLGALRELYRGLRAELYETSIPVAEMVKYTSNAFHSLKVAFANEIGTLCKTLGADAECVNRIFTADRKLNISPAYLSPGFAFGGSCLPKDLRALTYRAKEFDLSLPLIESIVSSNEEHLDRAIEMILQTGKTQVAILGLSFKPATDDLRESPQVKLVKRLLGEGRNVRIWDPGVSLGRLIGSNRQYIEQTIPHIGPLLCSGLGEAIENAGLIVLAAREIDNEWLRPLLKSGQIVIDLVNLEKSRRPQLENNYNGICW